MLGKEGTEMTMKLLSYGFIFLDQVIDQPSKLPFIGYVAYRFSLKIEGRDEWYESEMRQPFSDQGSFNTPDELVWAWDGNRENPTLTPSFLSDQRPAGKLHLFVRKGGLDILPDTTMDCSEVVRKEVK